MSRILVTTDAVGGVWRYSLELCSAWAERGTAVLLAVVGPAPNPAQQHEAAAIPGLQVLETGLALDWTAESAAALDAAAESLAATARAFGADSVHLHAPALVGSAAWPAPTVAVIHSCLLTWWQAMRQDPLPDEFRFRIEATARGLRRADAVIAPSAAFANAVQDAYRLGRPLTVVHNGRRPMALPERPRTQGVFAAGRLWDPAKNFANLDLAASRLALPVTVAGDIRPPSGGQAEFQHIRHAGLLDDAGLAEHLAGNTVFAGVSLYEPFGLVVLEAAQAGLALVLSDIPVFRELWNQAALFVDPRDPDAIRDGLAAALLQPQLLARAARCRAALYDRTAMAQRTRRTHQTLLDEPKAA